MSQGECYRTAAEKYSKLSIAITTQRFEMIPEFTIRNFGHGIRARFPGCSTLQSFDTIWKRNVMLIRVSSILFSYFCMFIVCTSESCAIRPAEGFLDRNPAGRIVPRLT